jgi:hypothetical protein
MSNDARGIIEILDREGLELAASECYSIREEAERFCVLAPAGRCLLALKREFGCGGWTRTSDNRINNCPA